MKKKKNTLIILIFICSTFIFISSVNLMFIQFSEDTTHFQYKDSDQHQDHSQEIDIGFLQNSATLSPKDAYAIVIGISDYPGTTSDLSYCDDDALDVYSMLINDYNFKPENVIHLPNSAATLAAINNAFDLIASQISPDDIFFFYYSGHGGAGTSSTGVISHSIDSPHPYSNYYDNIWSIYHSEAAYMRVHFDHFDVEYDYDYVLIGDSDLAAGYYYEAYTGYSTGFWSGWIPLLSDHRLYIRLITDYSITEWGFSIDSYEAEVYDGTHFLCSYDSIPSTPSNYYYDSMLDSKLDSLDCDEKYIVLDSCHSGGMIDEIQDIGRYIMTACRADEFSLESPTLQHGVFTNYFLDAINSASDSNGDGVKSLEEYYSYVSPNTASFSSSMGYTHHPQEYDGISGQAVLQTALCSINLNPAGNNLAYSFNLYGTGLIQGLYLAFCYVNSTDILYEVEDLTSSAPSATGFGSYSGSVQLTGASDISGYGLYAEIEGNRIMYINNCVSADFDGDTLLDLDEIMLGLNASSSDTDSDGLDDGFEFYGITDPFNNDTDADGMTDGYEVNCDLDPLHDDTGGDLDGDGLSNLFEFQLGTHANNNDTDNDDLTDPDELYTYSTDPTNEDTDEDGLDDGLEILVYFTDPNNPDSEGDGMDDGFEVTYGLNVTIDDSQLDLDDDDLINLLEFQYGSNPLIPDTDNDGLIDGIEVFVYFTNPNNPDSEGDGMDDFYEVTYDLNPLADDSGNDNDNDGLINLLECQCSTSPINPDSDGDFMTDGYEYNCSLDPLTDDAEDDYDGDGLNNLLEFLLNSLADSSDSDDDSMPDNWEYNHGLNLIQDDSTGDLDNDGLENLAEYHYNTMPEISDTDADGLADGLEIYSYLTDPLNPDTDGDGYQDGIEVLWGTDPLNARNSLNTVFFNIAGIVVMVSSTYFIARTTIANKRYHKKSKPIKEKLSYKKESEVYNAVTVEKKLKPQPKPKPVYAKPSYTPTYQRPSYVTPSQGTYGKEIDVNKLRAFILYGLPAPKSPYSVDGQNALRIANLGFESINRGNFMQGIEYMINALVLGVPEPMNSRIKAILLDSLDKLDRTAGSSSRLPYSGPMKKCENCGEMNKLNNTYCLNCGRYIR